MPEPVSLTDSITYSSGGTVGHQLLGLDRPIRGLNHQQRPPSAMASRAASEFTSRGRVAEMRTTGTDCRSGSDFIRRARLSESS